MRPRRVARSRWYRSVPFRGVMVTKSLLVLLFSVAFVLGCVNSSNQHNTQIGSADWQEIREENFSIRLPNALVREDLAYFDTYAVRFSNREMTVKVQAGTGSEDLNSIRHEARVTNFEQLPFEKNGVEGIEATYTFQPGNTNFQDPDKPYVKSVNVDCRWTSENLTFMVLYSREEDGAVVDRIFNTITVSCTK